MSHTTGMVALAALLLSLGATEEDLRPTLDRLGSKRIPDDITEIVAEARAALNATWGVGA